MRVPAERSVLRSHGRRGKSATGCLSSLLRTQRMQGSKISLETAVHATNFTTQTELLFCDALFPEESLRANAEEALPRRSGKTARDAGRELQSSYEVATRRDAQLRGTITDQPRAHVVPSFLYGSRVIGTRPSRIAHDALNSHESTVTCTNANSATASGGTSMKQT